MLDIYDKVKDQNVTKKEWEVIDKLKKDDTIMVLTANKGRVRVVMKKEEYLEKCNNLLKDEKTYLKLKRDPASKYRDKFVDAIEDLKERGVIDKGLYKKLYPTTDQPLRFYGLPKVHKADMPLRSTVSSIGTISYDCTRYLATVLPPLVGKTEHHVKNVNEFAKEVREIRLDPDEELHSYDVSTLFTSVPINKALLVIQEKLEEDDTLRERTPLESDDIIRLLGLCLNCTYFLFQGEYYLQIQGAAMGSPVSPIVCNLYMESFEQKALATAPHR